MAWHGMHCSTLLYSLPPSNPDGIHEHCIAEDGLDLWSLPTLPTFWHVEPKSSVCLRQRNFSVSLLSISFKQERNLSNFKYAAKMVHRCKYGQKV